MPLVPPLVIDIRINFSVLIQFIIQKLSEENITNF